jgi:3-keto-5-aminohexanoate cleavage enzyme
MGSKGVSDCPLIIEVAINGARNSASQPHVPLTADAIVQSADVCMQAGASILHAHAGLPVVGGGGHHDAETYIDPFSRILELHPGALLYPTLPGGGPGTTMAARLSLVSQLNDLGLLGMVPVDPGTMNYGAIALDGSPPEHPAVYQTTYEDVAWAVAYAQRVGRPCTFSAFEPGFVRLAEAYRLAGRLPAGSIVKLEFSSGRRLFGLKPTAEGLGAWLQLFDASQFAWMVTLRDGDPSESLAELAIKRGGHVRVGIEDYGGPRTPRNEELVAEIAEIGRRYGRRIAKPDEVLQILKAATPQHS